MNSAAVRFSDGDRPGEREHAWLGGRALLPAFLLAALAASDVLASAPRPPLARLGHDRWDARDGLPEGAVFAIQPGSDGFLWLGTQFGIVRFDGAHFTLFEEGQLGLQQHSYARDLLEDSHGAVWAALVGGVARHQKGRFAFFNGRQGLEPRVHPCAYQTESAATGRRWTRCCARLASDGALRRRGRPPDAGARAISGLGLAIPSDLALATFDDHPLYEVFSPAITAVSQPVHDLGQAAVEMLFTLMDGRTPEPASRVLRPASSCGRPAARGAEPRLALPPAAFPACYAAGHGVARSRARTDRALRACLSGWLHPHEPTRPRGGRAPPARPAGDGPGVDHADGALPIAAIFPTVGRYAVSGRAVAHRGAPRGRGPEPRGRYRRPAAAARRVPHRQLLRRRATGAPRLAVRDGALAIVGSNSSELSQAVAEESDAHGVLQITNVSTAADLTWDPKTGRVHPFVFRMCASDSVIGVLLADFARDRLAARRVAVLYEVGRTYSARLASAFLQRFSDPGAGRVTMEAHYLALETDFRPQLRLIKEFRPDVVFMPGSFPDATLMAVQARSLGLHATFLGGDAWSSPLLFQRGTPPGEAYYVELCSPAPEFDRRYEQVMGTEPPGCRAVLAYDAVRVIAAGLKQLGPLEDRAFGDGLDETRRRLRELVARSETEGVTGRVRFDERGNRRQGVALYAVEPALLGPPRALVRGWLGEP